MLVFRENSKKSLVYSFLSASLTADRSRKWVLVDMEIESIKQSLSTCACQSVNTGLSCSVWLSPLEVFSVPVLLCLGRHLPRIYMAAVYSSPVREGPPFSPFPISSPIRHTHTHTHTYPPTHTHTYPPSC